VLAGGGHGESLGAFAFPLSDAAVVWWPNAVGEDYSTLV
jgi:hypothetical protein